MMNTIDEIIDKHTSIFKESLKQDLKNIKVENISDILAKQYIKELTTGENFILLERILKDFFYFVKHKENGFNPGSKSVVNFINSNEDIKKEIKKLFKVSLETDFNK